MNTKFQKLGLSTTIQRSELMKKIKSIETKHEILLRKQLWAKGLRFRKNYKKIPGTPDIVFTKKKVAIFIDGEFWHGYNWGEKREKISANRSYWIPKIERNMQRDIENNKGLERLGYRVIRFWEHEVKKNLDLCVNTIIEAIK